MNLDLNKVIERLSQTIAQLTTEKAYLETIIQDLMEKQNEQHTEDTESPS